jgi:hypothetical protein
MRILDKIKAESTSDNRRKGQIKTVVVSMLGVISTSGVLDAKPIIKTLVDVALGVLTRDVFNHAITFNK